MKRFRILAFVLCVALMSTGLTGCGRLLGAIAQAALEESADSAYEDESSYDDNYDYNYDYDYDVEDEYSDPYSVDDMELTDFDEMFASEDYGEEDYGDEDYGVDVNGDMMTVGSDKVGYIDIPADYYPWTEAAEMPEGTIQYCDGTPYNIVGLVAYDMEGLTAYDMAQAMASGFSSDTTIDQESLTFATVTLGGVEAYQIYGYYPDSDQWLVTWIFESPYDSYVHYVSVEFLSDNMDLFGMVEESYRFTN